MCLSECPVGQPTTPRLTDDDASTLSWTETTIIRLRYKGHENRSRRGSCLSLLGEGLSEGIPYKWWTEAVWRTWAPPLSQLACCLLSMGHFMWSLLWFLEPGAGKPDLSEVGQLSQVTHFMVELDSKATF